MTGFEVDWDFVMDVLVVLLLFGAGFHLHQGREVLAEDGCEVYWQDFKGGYQGQLVNKSEAHWFQKYGSTQPPAEILNRSSRRYTYGRN